MRYVVASGRVDATVTGTTIPKPVNHTTLQPWDQRRKYHLALVNTGEHPVAVNGIGAAASADGIPYLWPGNEKLDALSVPANMVKDDTDAGAAAEHKIIVTVDSANASAESAVIYEWYYAP
jgi:hypothetical protein